MVQSDKYKYPLQFYAKGGTKYTIFKHAIAIVFNYTFLIYDI